jgi:hypothetical protein
MSTRVMPDVVKNVIRQAAQPVRRKQHSFPLGAAAEPPRIEPAETTWKLAIVGSSLDYLN